MRYFLSMLLILVSTYTIANAVGFIDKQELKKQVLQIKNNPITKVDE